MRRCSCLLRLARDLPVVFPDDHPDFIRCLHVVRVVHVDSEKIVTFVVPRRIVKFLQAKQPVQIIVCACADSTAISFREQCAMLFPAALRQFRGGISVPDPRKFLHESRTFHQGFAGLCEALLTHMQWAAVTIQYLEMMVPPQK